ncbi:glutamate synthase-related protein [Hydrogenimonas sp.]
MIQAIWEFLENSAVFLLSLLFLGVVALFIYDRYIQRRHQLLINYPVIGRFRYLFELLREPLRQYFAEESFFESRDKVDWVYKAAKDTPNYVSFSVSQPFPESRFVLKHTAAVLNEDEVDEDLSVTFGPERPEPFTAPSPIIRSAMSDGALSPEATRAMILGAKLSGFTFNTGEGGLTSNHLYTYKPDPDNDKFLQIVRPTPAAVRLYRLVARLINKNTAVKLYRKMLLKNEPAPNTYIFDPDTMVLFRVNWSAPLEAFPEEVPETLPNLVFQMSSGLYGVRDKHGRFDPERYKKVMRFCRMTEIKIAQGAKQTGGKLAASKVTPDIAYYRGVEPWKDLFSPNRFPYADTSDHLLDFVGELQALSGKPVGLKIVVSDMNDAEALIANAAKRKAEGRPLPDFLTIDGGDGGSATAPLEMMESVGLTVENALYVVDSLLKKYGLREDVKIIASGKILTPDDVVITLSVGADAVGIARGFMMSGGCIRARMCSGFGTHQCPVGMATQNPKLRASYLTDRKGREIANYHRNLLKGVRSLLAIMGKRHLGELSRKNLTYKTATGEIYFDVDRYFEEKFHR